MQTRTLGVALLVAAAILSSQLSLSTSAQSHGAKGEVTQVTAGSKSELADCLVAQAQKSSLALGLEQPIELTLTLLFVQS